MKLLEEVFKDKIKRIPDMKLKKKNVRANQIIIIDMPVWELKLNGKNKR